MAVELSYVLVTPYSLRKSRTGGIIARLLSRTGLELAGGCLFAPGRELVEAYAATSAGAPDPKHRRTQELIEAYVRKNFAPDAGGRPQRVLMIVLRGEDAVQKTRSVTGYIVSDRPSGETIRDTYGDYIEEDGRVVYFEPAVFAAPDSASARAHLALWASHADADGGLVEDSVVFPAGPNIESTLVLLKPDNFRFPNARAGSVIDSFSRSGLFIVGFKVVHLSVAQAIEFYRPVLERLERAGDPAAGRSHWESIIEFMCGTRPGDCPPEMLHAPGTEKCLALVYRGVDAVAKIRSLLGPTDPSEAPAGSVRREFGESVMVNAAHASDSPENARREIEILSIAENNLKRLLEDTAL